MVTIHPVQCRDREAGRFVINGSAVPFLTPPNFPCYCEKLFWPQSTHWAPELLWRELLVSWA